MKKKVEKALFELGITPDLKGFDYIRLAVEIIQNSKTKMKFKDGICVDIAKEFEAKPDNVERAIRSAFSKIDTKSEAFAEYLNIGRLTSYALLYTLAYRLKEDE